MAIHYATTRIDELQDRENLQSLESYLDEGGRLLKGLSVASIVLMAGYRP